MMKRILIAIAAFAVLLPASAQRPSKERLEEHVYTLAADSLYGRSAGSEWSKKAADYIVRNFEEIGLRPFVGDTSYFQRFALGSSTRIYRNVIGYIEGADPVLKDEYIVIGAHYDHLGYRGEGDKAVIYNGADDNASGTAAMMEIARRLKQKEGQLARTVVFAAFDAEEVGLHGSQHMVRLMPEGRVKFMISIDMVGWLRATGKLSVAGFGMLKDGRDIMDAVPVPEGLKVDFKKFDSNIMSGSDHDSFADKDIPALYATTGTKSPYHKPGDTAEKIDYDGLVLVTGYLGNMAEEFAGTVPLVVSGKASPKHKAPKIEFAVSGSLGSNAHRYTKGALTGRDAFAWNAGAFVQVDMGLFALRPEVVYQNRVARYPAENAELGGAYRKFTTRSVTVPVNLLLKGTGTLYFFVGFGGYYSYNIDGRLDGEKLDFVNDVNRHEYGWTGTLGMNIYRIGLSYTGYYGLSPVMKHGPKMKNASSYFTAYYKF